MAATLSAAAAGTMFPGGEAAMFPGTGRGHGHGPLWIPKKPNKSQSLSFSVRADAQYRRNSSGGGGGGSGSDFIAGFVLGGTVFGTLAYIFAPQIRRSILNEDEYGFRRPRKPTNIYYDEGLERTRQTLNDKITQLNSAIDNVSSRLRGGASSTLPVEAAADPQPKSTSK